MAGLDNGPGSGRERKNRKEDKTIELGSGHSCGKAELQRKAKSKPETGSQESEWKLEEQQIEDRVGEGSRSYLRDIYD